MHGLFFTALLAFVIFICAFKLMDRDFWWHVKAGEIMWDQKSLIKTEPFAYTRVGAPYLATYEWLAQILLSKIFLLGGPAGIILFRTWMMVLTAGFLLAIDPKRIPANSFLVIMTANAIRHGFMERPQLFTFVLVAVFLWLSFRYLDLRQEAGPDSSAKAKRLLKWFVGLEILWVNLHGAACLVGLFIVGALWLEEVWRARGAKEVSWVTLTLGAMVLAMFLSPNLHHTFTYLQYLLTDKTVAFIGEWQPQSGELYWKGYGLFWFLYGLSFVLTNRRSAFSLIVTLMMGYLSLKAHRHEMLFGITITATTIHQLRTSPSYGRALEKLLRRRFLAFLAAAGLFCALFFYTRAKYFSFVQRDHLHGYGVFDLAKGAYDFLEREKIQGRMFNTYGIGGYLIYRGYPERKVYIDGRNVDYGFEFMMKTYQAGKDPLVWKKLEDEYGFTYALIDYDAIKEKDALPYSRHLEKNPEWPLVYLDDWVAIYLKDVAQNQELIQKYRYELVTATGLEFKRLPLEKGSEKLTLLASELWRVVQSNPKAVKGRWALAGLFLRMGQPEEARSIIREAIAQAPYRPEPYEILAASFVVEEKWALAGAAFKKMIQLAGSAYPDLNYGYIASVFAKAGDRANEERYRRY